MIENIKKWIIKHPNPFKLYIIKPFVIFKHLIEEDYMIHL